MRYFLIISILIISGCAVFSKKEAQLTNPTLLEPAVMLKFSDVPYPAGFKLLPKDSYTFETSGIRVGLLKYQGKANPDQVVNFYKEQMALYNWNLLNTIEYGERLLNFDRESETCIVSVLPKGGRVFITVSVGPKSKMPKKIEKPVK